MARLDLELTLAPEELDRLTEAVETFCDACRVPPAAGQHLVLVLDELFTNIRSYGFPDQAPPAAPPRVSIHLEHRPGLLRAEVVDNGIAFDPLSSPPPDLDSDVEDRELGGLGLYFLKQFMHDISYIREGRYNRLRFAKPFDSAAP